MMPYCFASIFLPHMYLLFMHPQNFSIKWKTVTKYNIPGRNEKTIINYSQLPPKDLFLLSNFICVGGFPSKSFILNLSFKEYTNF